MNRLTIIFFLACQVLYAQDKSNQTDGHEIKFYSKILQEERSCLVKLPDSYFNASNSKMKYPILVLLDGSMHYKTTIGIVHFMASDKNRNYLMPETIIVAIENVDRERDFTFSKIQTKRQNTTGGGTMFLEFIENELLSYIDNNYRTTNSRTLIGHSLGGLFTLNAFLSQNSVFENFLSIDPSIWWDEQMMKSKIDSSQSYFTKNKLYIATANQGELNYERNKKRHDDFYSILKNHADQELKVKLEYFEDEDHRSVPLKAIYQGLKYLNQDFH